MFHVVWTPGRVAAAFATANGDPNNPKHDGMLIAAFNILCIPHLLKCFFILAVACIY
jgi:hypothetical protein